MKRHLLLLAAAATLFSSCCKNELSEGLQLIPMPNSIEMARGSYSLHSSAAIYASTKDLEPIAELISSACGLSLNEAKEGSVVSLVIEPMENPEGYTLSVDEGGVTIKASSAHGAFYGAQTFVQLLEDNRLKNNDGWDLPYLEINDAPRFGYRGLHIDISRHFYPLEFIEKCIDLAAHYKLNTVHLHLTDAGGWRLQIDKYPLLTSFTAWRPEANYMKWWDGDGENRRKYVKEGTKGAYGGYLTKDDAKDLVEYAAKRFIEIIPEIEIPAHSDEVLAAYPELSCSGKPYQSGDFCIGNEATFEFIDGVISEVVELFPCKYIHIGGDEAGKGSWKECPKCQKRMKDNDLACVDELQSYAIKRASAILAKYDRKLIGWDEILDGGLAEDATVMSWRGESGGIKAAKSHHNVIMTPGSHLYFDSYQDNPSTQPLAIGGYTTYLKTYDYNPIPSELSADEAKYILGAQANTWGEYMQDPKHFEYMLFPRMLSLSEVVWTMPENKDVESFKFRVSRHIPILQSKDVNTFTLSKEVIIEYIVDTLNQEMKVALSSERYKPTIRYTTDGTAPNSSSKLYEGEFSVKDSAVVKAALFTDDLAMDVVSSKRLDYHKAIGKSVHYNIPYYEGYAAQGEATFTNGYSGGVTYHDGQWQGFLTDIDVTIDMGEVMPLNYVSGRFMQLTAPGVFMPNCIKVYLSNDGEDFHEIGEVPNDVSLETSEMTFKDFTVRFNESARYVRFFSDRQYGFQFLDEIVVY